MRSVAIVAFSLASISPALASWTHLVYDGANGLRMASITGYEDQDRQRQVTISCVASGANRVGPPAFSVSLPATGEYSVIVGDEVTLEVEAAGREWVLTAGVKANDTSGFLASVQAEEAILIARLLVDGLSTRVTSGPIQSELVITSTEDLSEKVRQFLSVCA